MEIQMRTQALSHPESLYMYPILRLARTFLPPKSSPAYPLALRRSLLRTIIGNPLRLRMDLEAVLGLGWGELGAGSRKPVRDCKSFLIPFSSFLIASPAPFTNCRHLLSEKITSAPDAVGNNPFRQRYRSRANLTPRLSALEVQQRGFTVEVRPDEISFNEIPISPKMLMNCKYNQKLRSYRRHPLCKSGWNGKTGQTLLPSSGCPSLGGCLLPFNILF